MVFLINRLIIENVRIISPEEQRDEVANLYVNNGRIAEPFRKTEQDTVIDGTGLVAMPVLLTYMFTFVIPVKKKRKILLPVLMQQQPVVLPAYYVCQTLTQQLIMPV